MTMTWRPYRQGHLDSLCGLYAIVNAVRSLLGGRAFPEADATELFAVLMQQAAARWGEGNVVVEGLTPANVWYLVKHAKRHLRASAGLQLQFDRPFRRDQVRALPQLVRRLGALLQGGNQVVICPLHGRHAHWTVLTGVTTTVLRIADSSRSRRYRLANCRVEGEPIEDPERLRVLEPKGMVVVGRL